MGAVYGPSNPPPGESPIRRFGAVIGLEPDMEQRYRELHAEAWASVTRRLSASHVRNYSIFIAGLGGRKYLFSYFEYDGSDFEGDMRRIAEDPETQRWWRETDPCQIPLDDRAPGSRWSALERVFYLP